MRFLLQKHTTFYAGESAHLMPMAVRDIIVVGASAGGVSALQQLLATLPPDFPASVFITLHMLNRVDSPLAAILDKAGPLRVAYATNGEAIKHGRVYVAPPDHHLILHPGTVELQRGPRENLQRPCINAMFRSAAAAYGQRVAGVVLTGLLDDGAAGLWEIQQHGGSTIVQDPKEASYRSMPDNAIAGSVVEYILPIREISSVLARLCMSDNVSLPVSSDPAMPEPCQQACPECGGVMKAVRLGNLVEYNCHVGHRLSAKTMIVQKSDVIEKSMWNAICQTEELLDLLRREKLQDPVPGQTLDDEIRQRQIEITTLKEMLQRRKISPLKP